MTNRTLLLFAALLLLGPLTSLASGADPRPGEPGFEAHIMTRLDDLYRGASSHGVMEMMVSTKHWKRTIAMEAWSLGKDYSLIRILAPKKEKGTATLKTKDDLFSYLNKTGRTIKLSGGMMGGSWMGSHFTNDDLVRESRFDSDFDIKFTGTSTQGGDEIYTFDLIPKPRAAVVWGKVTTTVRAKGLMPISQVFFDEDGARVRELKFSNYMTVTGREIPATMEMRPLDSPGEFTRVTWKKLKFDLDLKPSYFSLQRLKSL